MGIVGNIRGPAGASSLTRVRGSSGAAGSDITVQSLSADSSAITTTAPVVVMTTTGVGVGTWHYRYVMVYRSAATTTGLFTRVNHTGTVTRFLLNTAFLSTGGAAATGIADGVGAIQTAGLWEGKAERVKDTSSSATVGVDTINADVLQIVEGLLVVSVTGSLELKIGTEVAASAITVQADSFLTLTKVN